MKHLDNEKSEYHTYKWKKSHSMETYWEVTADMIQILDVGVGIMKQNQEVSNCLAQTAHYHTCT